MERPATHEPEFSYWLASLKLYTDPAEALRSLRTAIRTYSADSLKASGSAQRMFLVAGAANVAAYNGAITEMAQLFKLLPAIEPNISGTAASGQPLRASVPSCSALSERIFPRLAGTSMPGSVRWID
jgi:hypothetical protein